MLIEHPVALAELQRLAREQFGDFVKAVVDVEQGIMALGHPFKGRAEWVEFDSLIIRPSAGNLSRSVEAESTRQRIREIVQRLLRKS